MNYSSVKSIFFKSTGRNYVLKNAKRIQDLGQGEKLACYNPQRGLPGRRILRREKAAQEEETTGAKQKIRDFTQ